MPFLKCVKSPAKDIIVALYKDTLLPKYCEKEVHEAHELVKAKNSRSINKASIKKGNNPNIFDNILILNILLLSFYYKTN